MKKPLFICFLFSCVFNVFAEQTKLLDRYEHSLQARIDLAINAKKEILVSSYAFRGDELGKILLSVLNYQALRGVKVKILIDGVGSDIKPYLGTYLSNNSIQIKIFNPLKKTDLINGFKYRMHDKLFIIDGEHLIMGGRNSKNAYYGKGERDFKDRDIYFSGEIADKARTYFLDLFNAEHVLPYKVLDIKSSRAYKKIQEIEKSLKQIFKFLKDQDFMVFQDARDWEKEHFWTDKPVFVHDKIKLFKEPLSGTSIALMNLIKTAKTSVIIDSPYFILTEEWESIFKNLKNRGIKIRFLTNSLMSAGDEFSVPQAGYLACKEKILKMGIELYEYYVKETLHAKTIVIDDKISVIGSYNFDPRSQNLNTELVSIIYDRELSHKLATSMNEALKKSLRIMPDGKPEGEVKEFPKTKRSKIIATKLIRYLIYPIFKDWF